MALRTVTFSAEPERVAPCTPQDAGVQGDHRATEVVFTLSPALASPLYLYRWEFVDGSGRMDTTETFTLAQDENTASVSLPCAWTAAGGVAELHLVVSALNGEGEEELTLYTLPARLRFASREGRFLKKEELERGLTPLIQRTQEAAEEAQDAASAAWEQVQEITGAELRADAAAQNANEKAAAATEGAAAAAAAAASAAQAAGEASQAAETASAAASEAFQAAGQVDSVLGQYDRLIPYAEAALTGTALTAPLDPAPAQTAGLCVRIKTPAAFGTGYTLAVSSWSAPVAPQTALPGVTSSWPAGIYTFVFDGSYWRVQPTGEENKAYTDERMADYTKVIPYFSNAQAGSGCITITPDIPVPQTVGVSIRARIQSSFTPGWVLSVGSWSAAVYPHTGAVGTLPGVTWPAGIYTFTYNGSTWEVSPTVAEAVEYLEEEKGVSNGLATLDASGKLVQKPTPGEIGAIPASQKGAASGVATLDSSGKLVQDAATIGGKHLLFGTWTGNASCTTEYGSMYMSDPLNISFGRTLPSVPMVMASFYTNGVTTAHLTSPAVSTSSFTIRLANAKSSDISVTVTWLAIY